MGHRNDIGLVFTICVLIGYVIYGADPELALSDCTTGQYMDTTNFQCYNCPNPPNHGSGSIPNSSVIVSDMTTLISPFVSRAYTVPVGCKCGSGYIVDPDYFNTTTACTLGAYNKWCYSFTCLGCTGNKSASNLENTVCMQCGNYTSVNQTDVNQTVSVNETTTPTDAPTEYYAEPDIYFDSTTRRCVCTNSEYVLIERDTSGELLPYKICEPCPSGSMTLANYKVNMLGISTSDLLESDYYICQPCPDSEMIVYNGKCVCSIPGASNPLWTLVGTISTGEACVLTSESSYGTGTGYSQIEYSEVIVVNGGSSSKRRVLRELSSSSSDLTTYTVKNSWIFASYLPLSSSKCRYLRTEQDIQYCQSLAALCVFQQYDGSTVACSLFYSIYAARPTWNEIQWDYRLMTPFIVYQDSAGTVLGNSGIQNVYSFQSGDKSGTIDYMQFVLAVYTINGTFVGWRNVTTQFEFCTPTINTVPQWLQFGYGYSQTTDCNLYNILQYFPEPYMYDMYLVDSANNNKLFPVPVRNVNLRVDGNSFPNKNTAGTDESDDILTRRFFLYDQVTSKSSQNGEAALVRFAKSISLVVTGRSGSVDRIYPPLLEITYEEYLTSDMYAGGLNSLGIPEESHTTVQVTFTVQYTESYSRFWRGAAAVFGIAISACVLVAGLRLYNWTRRNSRVPGDAAVDIVYLLRVLSFLFSTYAQIFFWVLFIYSAYFFIFFKMQNNVSLLLPLDTSQYGSSNDYFPFYLTLELCFFGQLFRMFEIVLQQTSADIFFVDWEKPRGKIASKRGDGVKSRYAPVSAWRTIFMANEWNELQSYRKYDVEFVMLLFATIMIAGNIQYAATPIPNFRDLSPGPLNIILRFFNTSFWFLLIAYTQILWNWAIQDRYISEQPTRSFVDLCTMAKISVFVMDEKYHGYYLHCRSQHEHADGSMLEISRQLRQEEQGLTTGRGLVGSIEPGMQTFEIYVTGDWKRQYDHTYRTLMYEELQGAQADTSAMIMRIIRRRGAKPAAEKVVKASRRLNTFLKEFIDQTDSDFVIQHREQTFLHRFLKTPPDMMGSKENIFFPDPFYGFDNVLFYGETWVLLLFNLLTINVFEFWTNDLMLSIFIAYLFDRLFLIARILMGGTNLSNKTLVDDRFLV